MAMIKKNILVFPCGSEIGLEIYRSLNKSKHFKLIGANSVSDHGEYVYENYIADIPFADEIGFIDKIKKIIIEYEIDFIYPSMDSVINILKENEEILGCTVISSPIETCEICLSKEKTYKKLKHIIETPEIYEPRQQLVFPVFAKPKMGYGARGTQKIYNRGQLEIYRNNNKEYLILEYLPGVEYTVDCFTDRNGQLLFCGPRKRSRISNGISVNTEMIADEISDFITFAQKLNSNIRFRGAWFFQVKRRESGELVLMEIACRLGGSSGLYRARGINFSELSLFDAMGFDLSIVENNYYISMDRALDNKYKFQIDYNEIFIDYDDTIILDNGHFNIEAMQLIFQCKNENKRISVLSAHEGNLLEELKSKGIFNLFDRVIHIPKGKNKADFIDNQKSLFIDDSFMERKRVKEQTMIPVFSTDMIQALLK